ncbi:MAG: LTA synthase family protein, partial [Silvanigrellaceae bacterium]|nr:LTA synthase family protein [Silvanigrellaceae bacterium]
MNNTNTYRMPIERWAVFFVLWQIIPFFIIGMTQAKTPKIYLTNYIYSVFASLFFFATIFSLLSIIKNKIIHLFILFFFILAYTFLFLVSCFSYKYLGSFVNISLLQYGIELQDSLPQYAIEFFPLKYMPVVLVFVFAITFCLAQQKNGTSKKANTQERNVTRSRLHIFSFVTSLPMVLFFSHRLNLSKHPSLVNLDGSFFAAAKKLYGMPKNTYALCRSTYRKGPESVSSSLAKAQTVILIVNESWGKDGVGLFGAQEDYMPKLTKLVQENQQRCVTLTSLFANSNVTDVSIPSLMSGTSTTS